jgi:hypothetical protein
MAELSSMRIILPRNRAAPPRRSAGPGTLPAMKPAVRGSFHAPEWTRTITGKSPHKALNLARLPIPPRAQGGEYIPGMAPPILAGDRSCIGPGLDARIDIEPGVASARQLRLRPR